MIVSPCRSICLAIGSLLLLGLTATTCRADFTTLPGWDGQLFPSYAVATATLRPSENDDHADENTIGDPRGLLGVQIEAPSDDTVVKVTIRCSEIMEPTSFTATLATEGET